VFAPNWPYDTLGERKLASGVIFGDWSNILQRQATKARDKSRRVNNGTRSRGSQSPPQNRHLLLTSILQGAASGKQCIGKDDRLPSRFQPCDLGQVIPHDEASVSSSPKLSSYEPFL